MVRTILTWRILGENLVGTCHVPTPGRAGGLSGAPSVGVLLLNAGPAPRSGNSDLSVRIGDRLALRGFPVFRFDFGGLGDSSGPTPKDLDAYWHEVLRGLNDDATAALLERIQREFGVARIVVGGLCAAALPSVRALDRAGAALAGLILLEPSFRLAVPRTLEAERPLERILAGLRRRLPRGGRLRSLAHRLRPRLPRDVNRAIVARWQANSALGLRSLVLLAADQATDRHVTRILESLPDPAASAVSCVRVPHTNHLFTVGEGCDAVVGAVERWVTENFGGHPASAARSGSRS